MSQYEPWYLDTTVLFIGLLLPRDANIITIPSL